MIDIAEQEFRIQLIGILKKKDVDEALPLLAEKAFHEIWCDKAVAIYSLCDKKDKAREIIEWAKINADVVTWHNCLLEYASALLKKYLDTNKQKFISFGQATPSDRNILKEVVESLSPIVEHIKADDRISNPIEYKALLKTITAITILGEAESLKTLASILRKYRPISLEYIRLVLSKLLPPDTDITRRIYEEYKNNLEADMLALVVEAELCDNAKEAFEKGKQLKIKVRSPSEKIELCGMLFQISQQIDAVAMKDANVITEELLGKNDTLTNVIAAAIQLRQGNIPSAKDILEKHRNEDNPQWLQVYSYCLFSENNYKDGLTYFSKAIDKFPSYEMYKVLGEAAFRAGFIDKAILAFETILDATPSDKITRVKVAQLYLKANDYKGAEPHLKKLWEIDKGNMPYGINYAVCVAKQGRVDDAIEIYKSLCNRDKPPVEAIVAVAQLYQIKHQPQEGFKFINNYKDAFWDNPGFLMIYMNLGYAANQETAAHEAFVRALELQAAGKAPAEIIQTKTLDDLLQHHKQWTERTEMICKNILQGKFPWLTADNLLNHATLMGWAIRTQPIILFDDIVSRASYTIYSTNGFHPREINGRRSLEPLEIPTKGSEVVIDLSSIITLYRLNLLEKTNDYFGKIYISTRYVPHLIADASSLEFHQLSHIKSTKLIKHDIDSGSISVLEKSDTTGNKSYPYVHEYTDDTKEHYYRLIDVCKVLSDNGKITKSKNAELLRIAAKGSGVDDKHPSLQYSQQILIELSTLKTLINFNIYDALKDSFKVSINRESKRALDADLTTIDHQEQIQSWNDELRNKINDFKKLAPAYGNKKYELDISMDSYHLAKIKNLNLLIDERVMQTIALNDDKFKGEIFSTDCLLKAFEKEKFLNETMITEAFLKLMRWRYRFFIPSVDMLLCLAKEYSVNPPGQDLREVALYLHDCMRDPGLFGGPENTTQKESMSIRLYSKWTNIVTEFLVGVWADMEFTEDNAKKLTEWVIEEFYPSMPKNRNQGVILPEFLSRVIIDYFLILIFNIKDTSRANKALQIIAENLNMNEKEYFKTVAEVIDRYVAY
ncbi:MAG: tetratricopeptide repeat protein [Sedimentisphaerales bacterium]|nr:tetratricopeptide repeat protein [Sedimentisphaerales bacterium]